MDAILLLACRNPCQSLSRNLNFREFSLSPYVGGFLRIDSDATYATSYLKWKYCQAVDREEICHPLWSPAKQLITLAGRGVSSARISIEQLLVWTGRGKLFARISDWVLPDDRRAGSRTLASRKRDSWVLNIDSISEETWEKANSLQLLAELYILTISWLSLILKDKTGHKRRGNADNRRKANNK